jgi:predicted TIM-barrel fold metal-dependent hydrolase
MKLTRRDLLWGGMASLALGCAGWKLLRGFADDPREDFTETIPAGLRKAGLDIHVHVLGTGTGGSGSWMSEAMRGSIAVRAGLWNLGLSIGQADLDQAYVAYLRSRIEGAGFLKQVVVLAQDYVYNQTGERVLDQTPFYVPNQYVAALARQYPEFLFGASIHPYRADALEELDRVAELGAVLVKWIPNVQGIELEDARCSAFYRRLEHHRMPLLVHVGDERAVTVGRLEQDYGDPRRLIAGLEEGVTVIAAHMASLGEREGRSNFDLLAGMFRDWPNLYADTSALTLVTRWRMLLRLAERVDIHSRLVHGSDFPLPPATTLFLGSVPLRRWWNAWKRENPLRQDFEIKQALGLPEEIYLRGYELLRPRLNERHLTGCIGLTGFTEDRGGKFSSYTCC